MAGRINGDNPAYPVVDLRAPAADFAWVCGLTKREAAAIAAMQGLLARPAEHLADHIAAHAIECADALLAGLEATGGHR